MVPEQAKAKRGVPLGLYVHVPFCASTCDFCAFYQVEPSAGAIGRYLDGVDREMALAPADRPPSTVFWGGGTPGLLAPRDLGRLGSLVRQWAGGGALQEWTVELAPGSVTQARLDSLREAGVTRVSLGIQSFDEERLVALGRQHSAEQARRAFGLIRATEFPSVNIDLMFALPGQTREAWSRDLDAAIALGPDHLSTYCLTLEEDTALWLRLSRGKSRPEASGEAALYEAGWDQLERAGYAQYEVSNFARPGHRCLHNLNTWRMAEWTGLGPSAASQSGGWRGANVADLERWLADVAAGRRATEDRVAVTPRLLAEDALIFGLRMNEGVDLAQWQRVDPDAPWATVLQTADRLVEHGLAAQDGTKLRLTRKGRLVADAVGGEIMEAFAEVGV